MNIDSGKKVPCTPNLWAVWFCPKVLKIDPLYEITFCVNSQEQLLQEECLYVFS